jgi:hypothetical protein
MEMEEFDRLRARLYQRAPTSPRRRRPLLQSLPRTLMELLESRILLSITVNGTNTTDQATNVTSLTWSETVASGTNRVMFVELAVDNVGVSPTVTYGGTSMTLVGRENGNHLVELFDLVNPTVGTANIVANFNASTAAVVGAVTFNGVNQSAPTGTFSGNSGTSTSMSTSVLSGTGDEVLDVEQWTGTGAGYTIGGGQTSQWSLSNSTLLGVSTTATGASTVTMGSTVTSSAEWTIGAVSVQTATVGAAAQLAFVQEPSNGTAGVNISPSITVYIEDAARNLVTTATSNVTLSVASGPGTISGTVTVAASGGIATFSSIKFDTEGAYTLTATSGSLTTATSTSFTISAAASTKLAFSTQPSNVAAGAAVTPAIVVDVEDQFGNIVTTDNSSVTLSVNTGPGTLSGTVTVTASNGIATFSNVELNTAGSYTLAAKDGSLTSATSNSFTVSSAAATKLAFSVQPSNVTAGVAVSPSIVVDVENSSGNLVTTDSSNVTLSIGSGPGALSGTVTVAASGGVATFNNIKLDTAGNYTLTASDGSLTSATSNSFTVSAAAASKLVYATQPSNVTAGVADSPSIVVDVEDQFGNVVTGNSSTVTLAVASGPGALSGTVSVAASAGVATFSNVKLDTAGNYTLTASDGTLTSATSSSFTVSAAAASKLAYAVQPSNVTAGVAESPSIVVDVEDQFGNIVTGNSSTVTLAVASGPGALSGTVSVAASAGVATFSNIKLDTAGNYTLGASDGTLTSATSNSFTVSPAAASKLVYAVQPSNVTAGVVDSPSIVVDVEDQFGNIVTSNTSNVTLSVGSGPGSLSGTVTVAASSGVVTFSNIKLDTAGNYTLAAADGTLTSATSNSFTVSPAAASQLVYNIQPSNVTAGVADSPSIVVDVEDQFGNVVTSNSSNVTLSVGSGPGALSGTVTVAASAGVATFSNIKLDTAGNYTLTASDGALTSTTSNSFTVSAAAASQLVYSVQPSNVTAGVADSPSIVVDVEDQFGNIVTGNSSNVTLSVGTGPGALSGTVTVAASSGVATFSNIKLDTAGNYTLTASDGTLTSATSNSFTVSPAAASKLVYAVQPSNVTAGVADSPSIVVDVEDQFGNIVTGNTSNITLSVGSGPGSLSGTVTVAASSGVATFNNIKLNTAGNYTLAAGDGTLTSATSNSFTVSPAAASQLVYNVQPSNVTAGVADSPSIVVDVEDQFGNIVTGNASNVTLSVGSGPGALSGTVTVAVSAGVATFSNIKLDTAGNYTLTAGDGTLTSATSNSFTVSAAAASKLVYAVQPSNVTAGVADSPSIVVDVEDQFGNIVTSNSSNVTLSVGSGPGTLSGTVTVAASAGVATFSNIKLDTAGNYTLTASDGTLTSTTSNSFTVSPAAASKLVYAVQPSNVTAGVAVSPSIVVDVEDQFGNIVTGNSSSVTLSVGSGPGSLGGTASIAASNGVATFSNAILDTAGNYTLIAGDGSLTSVTSSSFIVSAAAATKLVYAVQPGNVTAGVAESPSIVVDVEDQFGNIVTGNSSNVTLSVGSGPGILSGIMTVAASSGVATFSNVKLDTAGNYTLAAGDGSLTTATSNSFVVSPAAASQLVYAVQPSNVTAGVADSPSIVVDVEDQFGNIVTTNSSNLTLSVGSGPGSLSGTTTATASNGVATFGNVILDKAGNYTLNASVSGLTGATSNSFTVSPAAASQLAFGVEPSNVAAGNADSPAIKVDVEDQFGNIVTGNSSNVTLAVASGPGSLSGTTTATASNGVATFSDIVLNTVGNYTLAADDGSLTPSTSNSFTVGDSPPTVATPASATPNPVTGTTTALSVLGADVSGESILTYTWSATAEPSGSNPQFSANGTNASKNTTVTFNEAGNYTFLVTISDGQGGTTTSSVNVTVDQTLTTISVAPSASSLNVNSSEGFTATGFDQFGAAMSSQPTITWGVSGVGSINSSGNYTAPASPGTATIEATSGSVMGTATVNVTTSAPTVAQAAAANPNPVVTGTTTDLTVLGADAGGEPSLTYTWATVGIAPAPVNFSLNGTNAAKDTVATFTTAGTYTFQVTITNTSDLSTTSSVTVTVDATLTSITIQPGAPAMADNTTYPFAATGYDQFGDTLATQPAFTWSVDAGGAGGTINSSGLYSTPASGTGTDTIRATSGSVTATTTVTVTTDGIFSAGTDVGPPALPGYFSFAGGTYSVTGGDNGNSNTSDQFQFPHTSITGSTTLIAEVTSVNGTSTQAWAGIILRDSTANDAAGAGIFLMPGGNVALEVRTTTGAADQVTSVGGINAPQWVKLIRNGDTFTGYYSSDGVNWTQVGSSYTFTDPATILGGLFVTSDNSADLSTATFSNVSMTPGPTVAQAAAANPNSVTGTTTDLSVLGASSLGESALTYTWSTTGTPPASVLYSDNGDNTAKNTTATFSEAGVYDFVVTISDGNLTTTSSVTVTVDQTLTTITIAPGSVGLHENATEGFAATGFDQFDNAMTTQPAFTWSVTGVGSVNSAGVYTAPDSTGSATVNALNGSISGSASVTVTNAPPTVAQAAAANPTPVTGTTTNLTVLGADDGGEGNLTYTWTATDSPTGSNPQFSANGTNAAKDTTVTFSQVGDYTFTVTISDGQGGTVTSSVSLTVDETLAGVSIAPVTAPLHENETQGFIATGLNQFGRPTALLHNFTWSVTGVGSINSSGVYTAPYGTGTATVTATSGSVSGSASVTVTNAAPTVAQAAAATPNPVTGTTTRLSVLGADDGGETHLTYTWSVTAAPAGANPLFSANATNAAKDSTVTFNEAGDYTFTVTINDGQGGTVTTSVNVTVDQTLTTITITPGTSALHENGTQAFSATALDQFGAAMATQPSFAWTVTGVGSVDSSGLYTSPDVAGDATVHATSGSITADASVSVTNAPPTIAQAASATPNSVTGTTTDLTVLGADDGGEAHLVYTWLATSAPADADPLFTVNGTNAAKNSTVTFDEAGDYTFTVMISDGQGGIVSSSANVTVVQTYSGLTVYASPDQTVATGGMLFLGAEQTDQFGRPMAEQQAATWSIDSGTGGVQSSGTFFAPDQPETDVVRATVGSLSRTISLEVVETAPSNVLPPVVPAPAQPGSNGNNSNILQNNGGSDGNDSTIVGPTITYNPVNPVDPSGFVPDNSGGTTPATPATPATPVAPADQNTSDTADDTDMADNGMDVTPDRRDIHETGVARAKNASVQTNLKQAVVVSKDQSGPFVITPINRTDMLRDLDHGQSPQWDQDSADEANLKLSVGLASTIGSSAASVYLLWLIRGGGVLASLLSSAPVWKLVDPLFVLPSRKLYRSLWKRGGKNLGDGPEDRFFGKGRPR